MQKFLSDPVAVGMAILGVVLFVGSFGIDWQRAWYQEYEKKKQQPIGNSRKAPE